MGYDEAKSHLDLAKKQFERVQTASWDPQEPEIAVTWAFYSYENAVVAVFEKLGMPWEKTHVNKVRLANELYRKKILKHNIGPVIERLNELRKDVQYGEAGEELEETDLEELTVQLETFIGEVESIIE